MAGHLRKALILQWELGVCFGGDLEGHPLHFSNTSWVWLVLVPWGPQQWPRREMLGI